MGKTGKIKVYNVILLTVILMTAAVFAESRKVIVEPLIQTKWGQGVPYRNMLPAGHGTFCNLVAAAQVMKFHNHPPQGSGQSEAYTMTNGVQIPSVNFEKVTFDWKNMLNSYSSDGRNSTEQQRNAVASLIYHAGLGRRRDFISGNSKNSWPLVFTKFFRYDKSVQLYERVYFSDAEWEAMIKAQLNAGLPVMINTRNQTSTSNHYFIVDGYDNAGKFHFNCGWSGRHDGWYSLNALNIGENRWNYEQTIIINIKPDKRGKPLPYEMGLMEFSANKTSVSHNELFTVTTRIRNLASLDTFPGGQLGIALVDNRGRIVEVVGSRNRAALNPRSAISSVEIICFVPTAVKRRQYRLMAVIRPENGKWKTITKSAVGNGVPNSIDFKVTPEKSKTPGGGFGLALEEFSSEASSVRTRRNEPFAVKVKTRNIGLDAYSGGQLGVALTDKKGNIVEVIRTINWNALNPNSHRSQTIKDCKVPDTVKRGRYQLRIVVRPKDGKWRIATLSMPDVPNSIDFQVR